MSFDSPCATPAANARPQPIRIHHGFEDSMRFGEMCAVRCSTCALRRVCVPEGLSDEDARRFDDVPRVRRAVRRGETLFRAGDRFEHIYAVRAGSFKTVVMHPDGREQVTGYLLAGELLGLGGIAAGHHVAEAVALEDSQVCAIGFPGLEAVAGQVPVMQRQLHRLFAAAIVRDQSQLLRLGTMRGEARLASFLLDISARLAALGYSPRSFLLRMTREEIGSYLGLQLETVSRMFSRLQARSILTVRQREVTLVDTLSLGEMANSAA
ncbi:Fumarate and nitrate reduction regulatory protein [Pandoraea terrae]|uniref:Fumarate and nitrate reduction regulatory protein n=2 Tax=Pandoraea terrae TaxID=1537710 RepID=A0A5E4S2N2_9BURK|nr:Fumarate and nitrate reduction regulatory protein [Pandoraea terrae]